VAQKKVGWGGGGKLLYFVSSSLSQPRILATLMHVSHSSRLDVLDLGKGGWEREVGGGD